MSQNKARVAQTNAPGAPREITDASNAADVLQLAVQHHQAGRLDEADGLYRLLLEAEPKHPDGLHLSGLLALDRGQPDEAVRKIEQAIEQSADNPVYYTNLARAQASVGKTEQALESFQKSIELDPDSPSSHASLGLLLRDLDRAEDAIQSIRKAKEVKDSPEIEASLGTALQAAGQIEEAVECYRRAIEARPDLAPAHSNLGMALLLLGDTKQAIEHGLRAREIKPDSAEVHLNLGWALFTAGERSEAKERFSEALRLNPNSGEANLKMGLAQLADGLRDEAAIYFKRATELLRRPPRQSGFFKLSHDIDQHRHIYARGLKDKEVKEIIGRLEAVRDSLPKDQPKDRPFDLTAKQIAKLGPTYGTPYFLPDCPEIDGPAISKSWDKSKIHSAYTNSSPNIAVVDNFLSDLALSKLRAFCREATIWHDAKRGYVGTYLRNGFCAPLLLQIADELRRKIPALFKDHPLIEMWAYKYDHDLRGIETHADCAAINVNFWIAPDDANCDPESGGVVIYKTEAPENWDFRRYNHDTPAIEEFLDETGRDAVTIPHRANRAVIFNSNLFHKTDRFNFRSGFINRRVNITMLFGHRRGR